MAAAVQVAVRPAADTVGEILGGGRSAAAFDQPKAPSRLQSRPGAAFAGSGSRQEAGPLDRAMAGLERHRRRASLSACVLLVAAAVVATMPAVSAAGGGPSPDPSAVGGVDPTAVDPGASTSPGDQSAGTDGGDVVVYNVMQSVDSVAGSAGFQIYVVKSGDNLGKIAARFGITRPTVYWANTARLPDPGSLRVGLKLVIPPANGVTVSVKASNTLSGFAARYKVTTLAIMRANTMTDATLSVGQLLLIPMTNVPAIPTPKPGTGSNYVYHGQRLRWPVPASRRITQYYSRSHWGLDIGAPTGTPVVAAVGGKIVWAGWKTSGGGQGGGIVVWINSGGKLWTTYNHLSRVTVHAGQSVLAGTQVGNVGETGMATGPHLHFEVWTCAPWTGGSTSCARNPLSFL
jgi:murein DD-endopeptidase MepM/ murein hydrolase activator NlpD